MRYIVLLKAQQTDHPAAGTVRGDHEARRRGHRGRRLIDNAGLAQGAAGARVRLSAGELSVIDGPFAEAKEFISYAQYEVRSKEEAVEWASRFMTLHQELCPAGRASVRC